ncbi:ROK family protein [Sphingomonas piscis]|uniref:fructokinase n=1 Tax=Sphingomonas piscis TaxID=2714943 RepID=A0A6G7YT67_9SPHN|nr:ROK family protein [Sphingomonas piscis]
MIAGVELGGTKCICSLADASGDVRAQETVATTSPDETLAAIERILIGWQQSHAFERLGVASFGPVDLDAGSATWGYITATPKGGWIRTDVGRRLGAAVGVRPAFDTDVNSAALAEMRWGAGRGLKDFAYITVGTGVGVGLIVNGSPTRGFAHGELGHVRVARHPDDRFTGACPFHGDCVEGLASGSALNARLSGRAFADVTGEDPIWTAVAWTLAQLCHVIVCAAAPRRIAVGGGVVERQPHLIPVIEMMLRDSLAGYMPLPEGKLVISPGLGSRAGQLGPIALALDENLGRPPVRGF